MNIEKQTSYKCNFTKEECEILENAEHVLSDLLNNMNSVQCNYADCTEYPEIPEGVSLKSIEKAKNVLCLLKYLKEIHGSTFLYLKEKHNRTEV